MHPQLLDQVLDPDDLLRKVTEIEQARSALPEHKRVPQEHYDAIREALTDPDLKASAPTAQTVRSPDDRSRPPATVYLHPHAALSQFQSVITHCFEAQLVAAGQLPPSERGFRHLVEELEARFRRFGPCDIRWIEPALLRLISSLVHDKHAFPARPPEHVAMADRAKVFVVGDWATGLPQAQNVARSIKAQLDAVPSGIQCHVIHLGDTYYSGLHDEYEQRFLPFWPVENGSPVRSWSLNGNHDMYAGGHGYFEVLLRDARFSLQQGSSYFSLGNVNWQIVALDSSYKEPDNPDLEASQVGWLRNVLAPRDRAGTILLTHHQPFSAWEPVTSPLAGSVGSVVGDRQLEAWIWGHEHRCAVYEPGIDYGDYHGHAAYTAIIGHGGVPHLVSGPDVPPPQNTVDRKYLRWESSGDNYTVAEDTWSYGGFGVMDFDQESAMIQYFNELGRPRTDANDELVPPDVLVRPG